MGMLVGMFVAVTSRGSMIVRVTVVMLMLVRTFHHSSSRVSLGKLQVSFEAPDLAAFQATHANHITKSSFCSRAATITITPRYFEGPCCVAYEKENQPFAYRLRKPQERGCPADGLDTAENGEAEHPGQGRLTHRSCPPGAGHFSVCVLPRRHVQTRTRHRRAPRALRRPSCPCHAPYLPCRLDAAPPSRSSSFQRAHGLFPTGPLSTSPSHRACP